MRKIILSDYAVDGKTFRMKDSIVAILFSPHLRLSAQGVRENDRIARKIEAEKDSILLEEAEYLILKTAIETFEGYERKDLEFINRILQAPEVPVKEA